MSFELEVPKLDRICPGLVANNFNSRHGRNIYAWQERCRWCFWLRWSNASPPTPEHICILPLPARSWTVLRHHELREPTLPVWRCFDVLLRLPMQRWKERPLLPL